MQNNVNLWFDPDVAIYHSFADTPDIIGCMQPVPHDVIRLHGEGGELAEIVLAGGGQEFIFPDLVRRAELVAFHRMWVSKREAAGRLPARRAFDWPELKQWFGWLHLIDVLADGADFRFRVYGSNVARESGFDLTGRSVDAMPPGHRAAIRTAYERVYAERRPACSRHTINAASRRFPWERVVVPLAEDGVRVDRLMVCLYRVPVHENARAAAV